MNFCATKRKAKKIKRKRCSIERHGKEMQCLAAQIGRFNDNTPYIEMLSICNRNKTTLAMPTSYKIACRRRAAKKLKESTKR